MNREKKMIKAVIIAFLILLAPAFAMAQMPPLKVKVDCNKGQSVQSALDKLTGPATLVVTGTCNEHITITKNDVTLQGGTYVGFEINRSTIVVQGARRVVIEGVNVSGTRNGVVAYDGGSLTLNDSTIQNNAQAGVVAVYGSSATVNSSTIQSNLYGVNATDNSTLVLTNSAVTNNTGTGILVIRTSSARIGQTLLGVVGANTITNNGGSGVHISRSSNGLVDSNTIDNNTSSGISIEGGTATIINNSIKSNGMNGIDIYGEGHARIGITDGSGYAKNYVENNGRDGVKISEASNGFILGNDIKNNARNGIGIYRADCGLIGDNTIQGNQGHGMSISGGRLFQGKGDWSITPGPDIIKQNVRSGISGWNNASLDIRLVEVQDNTEHGIALSLQSTLRIYGSTVSGNHLNGIGLWDGSFVARYTSDSPRDTIAGNLGWGIICNSNSHLAGGAGNSGVSGNSGGQVNCPEFYDASTP